MAKKRNFEVISPNFKEISICGMCKSGWAKMSLHLVKLHTTAECEVVDV
jgi:hypothetical protein